MIIDIQRDYFPGGAMPLHQPEQAAARAGEVLQAFRSSGEPVIHIQHLSPAAAGFLVEGTDGAQIMDPVRPAGDELVITKRSPNSFLHTDLEQRLRERGTTEIVVVGMMTSMCVDATTRAGSDLGFTMTLVPDACAAPALEYDGQTVSGDDVHTAFVAALGQFYATVTPSAELISTDS